MSLGCEQDAGPLPPVLYDVEIVRETLDNGLQVAVVPDGTAPVVTAITTFGTGAFVETRANDGYSHLLEHMLFNGSEEVPDQSEFDAALARLGAVRNATASVSRVNFFYTLPSDRTGEGLGLMAGALRTPVLAEEVIDREIDVVMAEYDLADSRWDDVQYRRMMGLLFEAEYARKNTLGARDVLMAADRESLLAMHQRYYVPNNAMLVLAGDIDADEGIELARTHFGSWARAEDPFEAAPVPPHPPLDRSRAQVIEAPVNEATLMLGWQGPDAASDRAATRAARVLSAATRLPGHAFRGFVGAPRVYSAQFGFSNQRHTGVFWVRVRIGFGNERDVVPQVVAELSRVLKAGTTEALVRTAIDGRLAADFHALESATSHAHVLSNQWGLGGFDYYESEAEQVLAVKRSDILHLVERFFDGQAYAAVLVTTPESAAAEGLTTDWLEGEL